VIAVKVIDGFNQAGSIIVRGEPKPTVNPIERLDSCPRAAGGFTSTAITVASTKKLR
jgi:hypothetical protein